MKSSRESFSTSIYDNCISKADSYRLKGIALIMMVSMHLMKMEWIKYPEMVWDININGYWVSYLITESVHASTAVFAFISGYAWGGGNRWKNKDIPKKISSIYVSYWIITLLVNLPCLLLDGSLELNGIGDAVLCLAAVSSKLSTHCWYVSFFGAAVITFPIFKIIIDKWNAGVSIKIVSVITFFYGIRVTVRILSHLGYTNDLMRNFFSQYGATMPIILIGYMVCQYDFFSYISGRYKIMKKETTAVLIVSMISIIRGYLIVVLNFESNLEALWIVIEIYSLLIISRKLCGVKSIDILLKWLGVHSMYIWLIHSIFGYTGIQKFTYMLHIPVLIILMVMAISALISIPVRYLDKKLKSINIANIY